MNDLPKTRADAINTGSMHYFTGKACSRGHVARRFASNGGCDECLKERGREDYLRRPEYHRDRNAKHVRANPEANRLRSARAKERHNLAGAKRWATDDSEYTRVAGQNSRAKAMGLNDRIALDEWLAVLHDTGRCLRCGSTDDLTMDHVVPLSRGGHHRLSNIQVLCMPCNRAKSDNITDYRNETTNE